MTAQEIIMDIMRNEGVTQTELAKKMGVSRQNVSNMLHGDDMKVSTVLHVLRILGYSFKIERDDDQDE